MVKAKTKTVEYDASLKCALTQEELLKEADKMARAEQELSEKLDEEASMKKQFKAQIEQIECQRKASAIKINDKAEYRTVKCERIMNWSDGTVSEIRTDTGAVIGQRSMTAAESQMEIEE